MLVTYKIAEFKDSFNTACIGRLIHWIAGFVSAGVSVMTIAAISLDKVLAFYLHLRYKEIVTVTRVLKVVFVFWFFCVTAAVSSIRGELGSILDTCSSPCAQCKFNNDAL